MSNSGKWRTRLAAVVCATTGALAATASAQETRPAAEAQRLPAFPGAEGAGMYAVGGRGGSVYEVTNLDDSGPGSFRDAVSAGNRTVVFRVSGTIALKSRLDIRASNLTLAGQTAPGDGICFRDQCVFLWGNDVVVRYLRFRLGDVSHSQDDSLTVWRGLRNVIVDHCSTTWSVDECLSLAGNDSDVTVQWCLIGESLRQSGHVKGPHGYGSLMRASGPVTLHHNLWIHNDARNPRLGDSYGKSPWPSFDVRNNVIYNFGHNASGLTQGTFEANYVGNYLKPGPDSVAKKPINIGGPSDMKFFVEGNVYEPDRALGGAGLFTSLEHEGKPAVTLVDKPFAALPVRTTSAEQAYSDVLDGVGATLPKRDAVDARLVEHVRTGTGKMINSQNEVGGWPELKSAEAPADADHDGMPDAWEAAHGLDPHDPSDGAKDANGDGYTNLEEWLNY